MGRLWQGVIADQSLLAAWASVRRNALADGVAGPDVEAFEGQALHRLDAIGQALRDGSWTPGVLRRVQLESGRTLELSTVDDRIVETALATQLTHLVDAQFSPWSFAYRPGLGVDDAVEALRGFMREGSEAVLRADVKDCFDEIPRWPLVVALREAVPDPEIATAVAALLNRPVHGQSRQRHRGVHQGSPLAPVLANVYLDKLDRELEARGLSCVRYADDLALPLRTAGDAPDALEQLTKSVRGLNLHLNEDKTLVAHACDGVPFLGRQVVRSVPETEQDLGDPLKGSLYVDTPGALLRSRGPRLRVEVGQARPTVLHLNRLQLVVCVGRVGTTSAFLHQAGRAGLDLLFVGHDGVVTGRYTSNVHRDVALRHAQHLLVEDDERRDEIARDLVIAKILAMRAALKRWRSLTTPPGSRTDPFLQAASQASQTSGRMRLMGVEGACSRRYFRGLSAVIGPEWHFQQRQRRPPPDPINAMLSFGYTLLGNEAESAALEAGLDADVGFLHAARDGRRSLSLDLMEEFRVLVVDAAVVRMVRTRQVVPTGFTRDERGCRMDDQTRTIFLHGFERRMLTLHHQVGVSNRVTYRESLRIQARRVADIVRGRSDSLTPVGWR